jgi:CHAT domain-containing protein
MPISHAELITLTCPACGTSHTADIWLIVAPDERPDLVEQIRNGTLHTATCPQCGQTRTLDAPLLIFRPTAAPPILFSPAQQTTSEQDQQHAAALIGILRQHLGAAWNDAWLAQGPAVAPRQMLLVALTDDPALVQAVNAFLNARTWIDSYREVQAHPELLSDEALAMLDQAIAAARAANNADAVAFFEAHRALLRRCREVGAAAAFAEKIGVPVEELERREAKGAVPAVFASWLATAQQAERRFLQTGDRNALAIAVEAWLQILEHPAFQTAPLEFRCAVLNNAGGAFMRRYWAQGQAADLECALTLWTEALAATPPDSPARPTILTNLGRGLHDRYAHSGRLDDLEAAIAVFQQALDATPPDSLARPTILTNLGRGLHDRYDRSGRLEDLDAAIAAFEQALDATPPDSPDRPIRLTNLGRGLRDRSARRDSLADLEAAIAAFEQALAATPPDSPDRPDYLNNLGLGLVARSARRDSLADLEAAIAAFEQALDATPPDSPDRPSRLNNLGGGLRDRYARSGALADLEAAIALFQQALDATPPDSPDRPIRLTNLGRGLRDRSARRDSLADLEAAIAAFEQALAATPPDSLARPTILTNLGGGLRDRYARSGALADLDAAIAAFEQALAATPPDSPDRPDYLNNLGLGLVARSARRDSLADLEAAIAVFQQALDATPPDSLARPTILTNLGRGLHDRSARRDSLADLEAAIAVFQQALDATPPDSLARPTILTNLGRGLRDRYTRSGRLDDLDAAIAVFQQALDATPPDSPDRPDYLTNLGHGLHDRSARRDSLADLEAAIAVFQQALDATPPDSLARPDYLNNLGLGLHDRYDRSGRLEDLDAAIAAFEQALAAAPPGSSSRPLILTNLGRGLLARSARRGSLADLDAAITAYEQALAAAPSGSSSGSLADLDVAITAYEQALVAVPPGSSIRPLILTNLGTGLVARYARRGSLADLDAAITAYEQALAAAPPGSSIRPLILTNLGTGLRDRSARRDSLADLDAAIAAFEQALAATPPDSSARPMFLNNLGLGLRDRYARSGRLDDLEAAIAAFEQTRDAVPPDSPARPGYLTNLGIGLVARYARSGRLDDLDAAIAAWQQVLDATPPDSPDRPSRLNNLGAGLHARYARSGRPDDLKQARRSYAFACKRGQLLAPDVALTASQSWGRWASERHHWKEAVYAFGFGLETIEQLHRAQMRRSDQESWLSAARGLHTSAAYALVRAVRPGALRRAVEVAELGRARGLGETLARDRSDLSMIERDYPAIYERYRAAAEVVRSLERTDRAAADRQDAAQLSFTDLANRIRAARADLDAAIEAIRAIPGYEAFLRPPTYAEIAAAAQPGLPLVYLITTPQGSLALIVPYGNAEPEALLLDHFTENDLNGILLVRAGDKVVGGYLPGQLLGGDTLTTALATALPLLGERLIAPLAQRLRALDATGVTLIPTGLLSLLPLHAAIYQVEGASRCLLDEFDVAYAPSARVLAIAQREQQQRATGALRLAGVGNPLPSDATGDWALAELQRGLPTLRRHVQKALPTCRRYSRRSRQRRRRLIIWRATLKRLEKLAQQTPAQVIRAGSDLARAAALFAALPADARAFLTAIAARIPPSLTYARSELISILDLLPADAGALLYEQQATREALWAALPGATMAHFSCHGQFGLDDTLDSALLLAQESHLTLRDLVAGDTPALSNLRLVALSACQTAITDFRRLPDESIGLPGGFLQAGVPAVVGTLWSVNDLSTALLMHRFYELHLHGDAIAGLTPQPPARALRLAQQWLRDLTYAKMFAYFEQHRQLKAAQQHSPVPVSGERMPLTLIEEWRTLAEDNMLDHANDRPYANPVFWAPFTFNGAIGGTA